MKQASPVHTWLATAAAILTIFSWLTGVHTISLPKAPDSVAFTLADNTLGIVVFISSHLMVWASAFFLALLVAKRTYRTNIFFIPSLVIMGIIGYCVELPLYDAFYDATGTVIYSILTNTPATAATPVGDLLTIGLPMVTMVAVWHIVSEWCCPTCGRLALKHLSTRDLDSYEEEEYITNPEGDRIRRVKLFQKYEVQKECNSCVYRFSEMRHFGGYGSIRFLPAPDPLSA